MKIRFLWGLDCLNGSVIVWGWRAGLLFSLAKHSQALQYNKSWSVSFLHKSFRISFMSDQI